MDEIRFANIPSIDLGNSRPLNFVILDGGEMWIWRLLFVILLYYSFRFYGLAIPDLVFWRRNLPDKWKGLWMGQYKNFINHRSLETLLAENRESPNAHKSDIKQAIEAGVNDTRNARKKIRSGWENLFDYIWRRAYFWLSDAGVPVGLSIWAFYCCREQLELQYLARQYASNSLLVGVF